MGKKPKYVYALNGQDAGVESTVLYAPQYIAGAGYRTTLSIVNLDGVAGTVTLRLIGDDGLQIGETRSEEIQGKGKVRITDQNYFVERGEKAISGYVEVRSRGVRLVGDVVFGDPEKEAFASSLPLVSELLKEMVFGHVVTNDTYWTGMVLLNPGLEEAGVTINLYDRMGNLVKWKYERVPAGHRTIGLLTGYFPGLMEEGFQQGYMKVTSDHGVAGFALFGNGLRFLSAIPPQVVPED
jgi:hypothetical protein